MWLRSLQTGLLHLDGVGQSNRYDDVTGSEPMMSVTVSLPYSIFHFVCISLFVIFLIGQNGFVDPRVILLPGLAINPCTANGSMQSPMSFLSLNQALKGSVTQFMQSLFEGARSIARAARKNFLSRFNTSKRPSKSTTLLLPNLIIVLIIGPWIGPALAPFCSFLPLPFTFWCLRPITVTQATAVAKKKSSRLFFSFPTLSERARHGTRAFCQLKDQTAISGCHF